MKRLMTLAALIAAPAGAEGIQPPGKPYSFVETGERFDKLWDALFAVKGRKLTLRFEPGLYRECGVQVSGNVTFQAAVPGKVILDGKLCEGKAGLVLRGDKARVEGFIFAHYHGEDGNGAGIRLEKGDLAVVQSWFRDSDEGILAANDPRGTISIDRSTFTHLGRCDRGLACAHSVYLNFYDRVVITNSRFEAGDGGHYIKSRARVVEIRNNVIDDSAGRRSNYLIDLPAGAAGRISGNWLVQGAQKENPGTIIAVSAEGREHPSDGLVIEGNTVRMAPGARAGVAFVRDWSGGRIVLGANQTDAGVVRYIRQ